ncbi:MAG: virulence RhuM family protein [Planctomycetes bacterium]|nr:virulence RhuM family protein [Planctomycetota bacterium]
MLFGTERSVITKHLRHVFRKGELERESVCAKLAHTAEDGKVYQTGFDNLDAIISVGYPVSSVRGTPVRIWATEVLRDHVSGDIFCAPWIACKWRKAVSVQWTFMAADHTGAGLPRPRSSFRPGCRAIPAR